MGIQELIADAMMDYLNNNSESCILTSSEIKEIVHKKHGLNKNTVTPADYCYNRINKGIEYNKMTHLFIYEGRNRYRLVGKDFVYSGPVYCRCKGEQNDEYAGEVVKGHFMGVE